MTQDRATPDSGDMKMPYQRALASSHYTLLGVHPSASVREIRQAYRDLSKLYHPDTTSLPAAIATTKFQQLNEAYATLSSPERRVAYDQKIGYSRVAVSQPLPNLSQSAAQSRSYSSSAYLDPTDRPLSPGEVFALFILGLTFVACLVLAITIGMTRGEAVFKPITAQTSVIQQVTVPEAIVQPETSQSEITESETSQPETTQPEAVHVGTVHSEESVSSTTSETQSLHQTALPPFPLPAPDLITSHSSDSSTSELPADSFVSSDSLHDTPLR